MPALDEVVITFLMVGGLVLSFMIYIPALKTQDMFSGRTIGRRGLNELLDSYQKALNKQTVLKAAPILLIPGLLFASDPGTLFACLALTVCGAFLMRRTYSAERRVTANYRKEANYLLSGIGDSKSALSLLDKLDAEVRRGEIIMRSGSDFYLFPSAIVADRGGTAARPWIVPTGSIKYMVLAAPYGRVRFAFVYLYDEQERGLGAVKFRNPKGASAFMSELKQLFGVQTPNDQRD